MNKSRIIALVLCIMMITPFIAACDGGNTPADTTPSSDTTLPSPSDTTTASAPTSDTTTSGTSDTTSPADTTASGLITDKVTLPEYKVLFVGNSFTYYNEMFNMFRDLVRSYGGKVTVTAIYKGGYYISQFNDENDPYGKQVAAAIKKKYDIIFIQEQSMLPSSDRGKFYDSVREFKAKVEPYGSRIMLYETWGYKADHSGLKTYGLTTSSMEARLRASYKAIGDELGLTVSYAGAAMQYVYEKYGDKLNVYHTDSKHPSAIGSYLIACVHFATLYGVSPVGIEYTGGLTKDQAKKLQEAAALVVNGDPASKAENISSVGVTAKTERPVDPSGNPNMSYYGVDMSKTVNLKAFPTSNIISVVNGDFGSQSFSGILGDKGINCSTASGDSLTPAQLADLADIGYGVSVIGVKTMSSTTKSGYTFSGLGALVNGHWGSSWMANWSFDTAKYNVSGASVADGKYVGLITLNFGKIMTFDALGFFSGNMNGFPQTVDVYVSDDGVNWTLVPSACYDAVEKYNNDGSLFTDLGKSPADPWNSNTSTISCLFSMNNSTGKYIRLGIINGRGDNTPAALVNLDNQLINTRELVVYGKE